MAYNLGKVKVKLNAAKIKSRAERAIKSNLRGQLDKVADRIRTRGGAILAEAIKDTRTYRGLLDTSGVLGQDLQAEFGLTERDAGIALRRLDWVVRHYGIWVTNPKITKVSVRGKSLAEFHIHIFSKKRKSNPGRKDENRKSYYQLLTQNKAFYYTSTRALRPEEFSSPIGSRTRMQEERETREGATKYKIEWMKWILDGEIRGWVGDSLKHYGIRYNLVGSREKAISRSGRAIMTDRQTVFYYRKKGDRGSGDDYTKADDVSAIGFPYQFPMAARSRAGGGNFLDDTANKVEVRTNIRDAARKIVLSALKNPATITNAKLN